MRTISVVIADENQAYSRGLVEYLQHEYGQAFDISCFSSLESLIGYLQSAQQTDILLIDQKLYSNSIKDLKAKSILILTENNMEIETSEVSAMYKYQTGDKLAKNMLQSLDSTGNDMFTIHKQPYNSKLITVYSPSGGSGKSTVAYNMSRQYALQGKKAILISMESYACMPIFKSEADSRGLSYLLYLIKNKINNFQVKFDAVSEFDANSNIFYIPREANSLEYKDIDPNDIALLLEFLRAQSGYDAVIFDMDSAISEWILNMFKYSDVILNVIGNDPISKGKHKSFINQLSIYSDLLNIDLSNRIISVNNKVIEQTDINKDEEIDINNKVEIPYFNEKSLMENGYYPELAHFKQLYDMVEDFFMDKRE